MGYLMFTWRASCCSKAASGTISWLPYPVSIRPTSPFTGYTIIVEPDFTPSLPGEKKGTPRLSTGYGCWSWKRCPSTHLITGSLYGGYHSRFYGGYTCPFKTILSIHERWSYWAMP